jgi:heterodisulfide reductase subunit B
MKYHYYPGCSLEGTAMEYDASTRAVMKAMSVELMELEDWTCCGASAADTVSYLLSIVLPARNLALAEATKDKADLLVPCSACYLNLRRVEDHIKRDEHLKEKVNTVLNEDGLGYHGGIKVRHLLDVLASDVGHAMVNDHVARELKGLRVAPYYGCQALRPYADFDDAEQPRSMEPLIEALGAEVYPWPMGAKCCGAGLMTTKKEVAMDAVTAILAHARGADCIVTVCPMCQMNLESFQKKACQMSGEALEISILYLPQLMGLAFGLPQGALKLDKNMAFTDSLREKLQSLPATSTGREKAAA